VTKAHRQERNENKSAFHTLERILERSERSERPKQDADSRMTGSKK
jgi:hypothetical protein